MPFEEFHPSPQYTESVSTAQSQGTTQDSTPDPRAFATRVRSAFLPAALFPVSTLSYRRAKDLVSVVFLLVIPMPLWFSMHIVGEQEDLYTITTIVGGICAICFSVPILLKEVDFRFNFWQEFFIAGLLLFIATVLGIIEFLHFEHDSHPEVTIHFFQLLFVIAPVSLTYLAGDRLQKKLPGRSAPRRSVLFNVVPSLGVTLIAMVVSIVVSKGDPLFIGLLVASLFSLFHVFIILVAIVIEFVFSKPAPTENDQDIRQAIADIVEENRAHPTTEQELMSALRWQKFRDSPERISETRVLEWVTDLHRE